MYIRLKTSLRRLIVKSTGLKIFIVHYKPRIQQLLVVVKTY